MLGGAVRVRELDRAFKFKISKNSFLEIHCFKKNCVNHVEFIQSE